MAIEYDLRTLAQQLALLDQGAFLEELEQEQRDVMLKLREHQADYGGKPKGTLTITLQYQVMKSGDVEITGVFDAKTPKKPAASGTAYSDEQGNLSLYSPLMKRMSGGLRDVAASDRETRSAGE